MSNTQFETQHSENLISEGRSLATKSLSLLGSEVTKWAYQYADTCQKVVTARIEGDGENYHQALVFPLASEPNGDFVCPLDVQAFHILLELPNGTLVYFKLLEYPRTGFALGELLSRIGHCFIGSTRSTTNPAAMERCARSAIARRFAFSDFALDNKLGEGFSRHTPDALEILTKNLFCGFFGSPHLGKKTAKEALISRISNQFNIALSDFNGRLNQDVVRSITRSGETLTILRYNTFTEGHDNASHFRIQAADAFPLLGSVLAEIQGRDRGLRLAIDVGKPLWPTLAAMCRTSEENIRSLRGKSIDDIGEVWGGRITDLFRILDAIPPEWRPKTKEDWAAFSDFAIALETAGTDDKHTQWLQDVARIGWCKARRKFEELRVAPSGLLDVPDLVKELISGLLTDVLPEWPDTAFSGDKLEAVTKAVEASFYGAGVLKQIKSSVKWHELQLQETPDDESAQVSSKLDNLSWPVPYLTPQLIDNDIFAHFLRTKTQIMDEGCMMKHCVGSYSSQCLYDGVFIVSLRLSNGCRISTAELKLVRSSGVLRFEMQQHRGKSNENAGFSANKGLNALIKRLNQEDMMDRRLELKESQNQRNTLRKSAQIADYWTKARFDMLKEALKVHSSYEHFHALAVQNLI